MEQTAPMTIRVSPPARGKASRRIERARLLEANINPRTGLATDYLNHFNEAIMMLEMAPQMPDCLADLRAWRPLSYREHFSGSTFKERELAIAAYDLADPELRRRLDELADTMNDILVGTIRAMLHAEQDAQVPATDEAVARLHSLIARAGAVIHGDAPAQEPAADEPQAAVDALFAR